MALDEPNENDSKFEANGYTFCAEPSLLQRTGKISIDVSYMGFVIQSENPLSSGSSCGSSCGSCGSH